MSDEEELLPLTLHADNTLRVGDTVVGHADPLTAEQARAEAAKHLSIEPVRKIESFELMYVSLDAQPNAFGEGLTVVGKERPELPLHRTQATFPPESCGTCGGGGCPDCTDPS